jgi:aminobenzoyl-glutamate transport protein
MGEKQKKASILDRWMNSIEWIGNKLPDTTTLFVILACIVIVLSAIFSWLVVTAIHPGTGE